MSKPYRDQRPESTIDIAESKAEAAGHFAELFGTIAHDLRSPLSTITASASILGYEGVSEDDRIECANYIMRSVEQMKELLEQATDVVELEARSEPMELDDRLLSVIAREATEKISERAGEVGVGLSAEIDDELRVACNGPMLTRAFELLLGACVNSAGATTLAIRATKVGERVQVEVVDDGAPVPEVDIPRLFDRYWERDRGCRPKIGLAMRALDRIVRQHRGKVCAEAVADGGMRFVIDLPAAARRASAPGAPGGGFAARLRGEA